MQFLTFILFTVLDLYIVVLLLRVWMQWARCDFYNPFAQFVVKITQPVVRPLRRVLPAIGPLDTASIVIAYALVLLKLTMQLWFSTGAFTFLTLFIPIGLIELLTAAGKLVFWLVLARALLSWISQGRNPIDYALMQLTEPLMAPIRRIIPAMGGLDFSAMLVILILYALNYLRADVLSWLIQ
ncbi:YggT family protein [Photorhabdus viridis]|uniref:YggT family protein n=1 Tax=Photorhabdus viridis TaxID=3163327 RepID=UPI0033070F7B